MSIGVGALSVEALKIESDYRRKQLAASWGQHPSGTAEHRGSGSGGARRRWRSVWYRPPVEPSSTGPTGRSGSRTGAAGGSGRGPAVPGQRGPVGVPAGRSARNGH